VEGIAEATQNVVQGFSGWLSDKLQKRKALALVGYFVSALGKPLVGIATAWPGVLGGRVCRHAGNAKSNCVQKSVGKSATGVASRVASLPPCHRSCWDSC